MKPGMEKKDLATPRHSNDTRRRRVARRAAKLCVGANETHQWVCRMCWEVATDEHINRDTHKHRDIGARISN